MLAAVTCKARNWILNVTDESYNSKHLESFVSPEIGHPKFGHPPFFEKNLPNDRET